MKAYEAFIRLVCKFQTLHRIWFLPECVMKCMNECNLSQHEWQVKEWLSEFGKAEEQGTFIRKRTFEKQRKRPVIVFKKKIGDA